MATFLKVTRKSSVLNRPALPCLGEYHTINLLAGCPYSCRYCYAQGFRSNPGHGTIHVYENSSYLLTTELQNKRKKPTCVYFSTACEPFVPEKQILEILFNVMETLLNHGISILISTKSSIPQRFIQLFTDFHALVHVQIGLTTSNDTIRQFIEPNAFPVEARLESLHMLTNHNISAEVRIDPLIPGLTDTAESFESLCNAISRNGATRAACSFLFLRRSNINRMKVSYKDWSFDTILNVLYTKRIEKYCGHGSILIPNTEYRRQTYERIRDIAENYGITLVMCRCKNPDITSDCCHPDMSHSTGNKQLELFHAGEQPNV